MRFAERTVWILLRGLVVIISVCPNRALMGMGEIIAWVWAALPTRDRTLIRRNIALIYGLGPGTSFTRQFERQVLRHQVLSGLELIKALVRPDCIAVEGFAEFETLMTKARAQGKGAILITAHLGSWELLARYCARASGHTFYGLAKSTDHPGLMRFLVWMRQRLELAILWVEKKTLLRDMMQVLKDGKWLGFIVDQKPMGRKGPVVSFLGQPTEFVSGPGVMAGRFHSPVISAFLVREAPFHYRLRCRPVAASDEDLTRLTQAFAREVEDLIQCYPEQWCWNYKRWR